MIDERRTEAKTSWAPQLRIVFRRQRAGVWHIRAVVCVEYPDIQSFHSDPLFALPMRWRQRFGRRSS